MADDRLAQLTERERQVIRLIARNRSTAQIAAALEISTETAQSHIKNARAKVGGVDRYALADALADWEGRPHPVATQRMGMEHDTEAEQTHRTGNYSQHEPFAERVSEERATFAFFEPHGEGLECGATGRARNALSYSERLARIVLVARNVTGGIATLMLAVWLLQLVASAVAYS